MSSIALFPSSSFTSSFSFTPPPPPPPPPPPLSARINVRPAMSCSVFAPLTDSSSVSIARSVQNMRYFATRLELVTRAVV